VAWRGQGGRAKEGSQARRRSVPGSAPIPRLLGQSARFRREFGDARKRSPRVKLLVQREQYRLLLRSPSAGGRANRLRSVDRSGRYCFAGSAEALHWADSEHLPRRCSLSFSAALVLSFRPVFVPAAWAADRPRCGAALVGMRAAGRSRKWPRDFRWQGGRLSPSSRASRPV